jgi:hypothetical protein
MNRRTLKTISQGSRSERQPWAVLSNPFGINQTIHTDRERRTPPYPLNGTGFGHLLVDPPP